MEIKINSYSSQSSLISSLLCFIIGGILYAYAEVVLNFTSIAIGVVLSIVGVFSLITFYMDYKKGEIKKAKNQFIKAVTLKNDVPEFHYNLAYVYKNLNKPQIAQTYLDNYNKLTNQL
jgi:hypothetical protein